jgi:hypothetical protein
MAGQSLEKRLEAEEGVEVFPQPWTLSAFKEERQRERHPTFR